MAAAPDLDRHPPKVPVRVEAHQLIVGWSFAPTAVVCVELGDGGGRLVLEQPPPSVALGRRLTWSEVVELREGLRAARVWDDADATQAVALDGGLLTLQSVRADAARRRYTWLPDQGPIVDLADRLLALAGSEVRASEPPAKL